MSVRTRIPFFLFLATSLLPVVTQADMIKFNQGIYSALQTMNSRQPDYKLALSELMISTEMSDNNEAKEQVEAAVKELTKWNKSEESSAPSQDSLGAAITNLQNALRLERITLNRSYAKESDLVERLIKVHLFGDMAAHIQILPVNENGASSNSDRNKMLVLMMEYIADPRSADLDPDVHGVVSGKEFNGDSSKLQVKFIPDSQTITMKNHTEALSTAADFQVFNDNMHSQDEDFPMNFRASVVGNRVVVGIELLGVQYFPFLENWVRNGLSISNGNRYLFKTANGFEAVAKWLNLSDFGGLSNVQKKAKSIASILNGFESAIRTSMASNAGKIYSVEDVNKYINQSAQYDIDHVNQRLQEDLKSYQSKGDSTSVIQERTEKAAQWTKDIEAARDAKLANVSNALEELKKSAAYLAAGPGEQEALALKTAQTAGKVSFVTASKVLQYATYAMVAFYAYRGITQYMRTDDPDVRLKIENEYGTKIAVGLTYLVPGIGEAVAAWDLGTMLVVNPALKLMNVDVTLPHTQEIVQKFYDNWMGDLYYWAKGISHFEIALGQVDEPLFAEDKAGHFGGHYFDNQILEFTRIQSSNPSATELASEISKLADHLKDVSGRMVGAIFRLNEIMGDKFDSNFQTFEIQVEDQMTDANKGYIAYVESLLASSQAQLEKEAPSAPNPEVVPAGQ